MSVFAGVGERTREGNDFYHEMQEAGVLDKISMVFGQMNEPPGNRLRVALSGLTMAEKFRDEGKDVLLFVDNIYRYTLLEPRYRHYSEGCRQRWAISQRLLRKWVSSGTHYYDKDRLDYVGAGGIRTC